MSEIDQVCPTVQSKAAMWFAGAMWTLQKLDYIQLRDDGGAVSCFGRGVRLTVKGLGFWDQLAAEWKPADRWLRELAKENFEGEEDQEGGLELLIRFRDERESLERPLFDLLEDES